MAGGLVQAQFPEGGEPMVVAQTWYDERGTGEPFVLLHGGLSDPRFFEANVGPLAERFRVLTPEPARSRTHAGRSGPFTFDAMPDARWRRALPRRRGEDGRAGPHAIAAVAPVRRSLK
jgi:hypothetical protein